MSSPSPHIPAANRSPVFATTRWSLVAACQGPAAGADAALESLCRSYWYPIYAYVRRFGFAPADAQDIVQSFFLRLLEKSWLRDALPERGRFRGFLLVAVKRFLANERRHGHAQKRGGDITCAPLDAEALESRHAVDPGLGPDQAYERLWALQLLEHALVRLADEYARQGRSAEYRLLKPHLGASSREIDYETTARALGVNPGAARVAVHRLRKRFREAVQREIAETVADPACLDEELRHFVKILGQGP